MFICPAWKKRNSREEEQSCAVIQFTVWELCCGSILFGTQQVSLPSPQLHQDTRQVAVSAPPPADLQLKVIKDVTVRVKLDKLTHIRVCPSPGPCRAWIGWDRGAGTSQTGAL